MRGCHPPAPPTTYAKTPNDITRCHILSRRVFGAAGTHAIGGCEHHREMSRGTSIMVHDSRCPKSARRLPPRYGLAVVAVGIGIAGASGHAVA